MGVTWGSLGVTWGSLGGHLESLGGHLGSLGRHLGVTLESDAYMWGLGGAVFDLVLAR